MATVVKVEYHTGATQFFLLSDSVTVQEFLRAQVESFKSMEFPSNLNEVLESEYKGIAFLATR